MSAGDRWLAAPLPAIGDEEGDGIPPATPPVVDAHVHLFPDPMWAAIHTWFDQHAWPVRYRMTNAEVVDFLLERGVGHVVALHYAHRPGMAAEMNRGLARFCESRPLVTGLATVFPGERDTRAVLEEGFDLGLAGVKLHLHVQGVAPDAEEMEDVYRCCADHGRPLVMHAGREPRSPAYTRDPHEFCSADRIARVLRKYSDLRLCIPHLGGDEFDAYRDLILQHDNLWLDTTMMLADYFPCPVRWDLLEARPDRILYGTDFPNIPYAWDRELRLLLQRGLDEADLEWVLHRSARELFGLQGEPDGRRRGT